MGLAQLGYEHLRLASTPRVMALHAAGAVALGVFGLALGASIHGLLAASGLQRPLLLALLVWPIITALPVFLVTLVRAGPLRGIGRRT